MTQNLSKRFEKTAVAYPDEIAIMHKEGDKWKSISYSDFRNKVRAISAFLLKEGIRKQDKIGILMENRPEWPLIFFSTISVGGVLVPINPAASREEVENILRDSECRIIFISQDSLPLVKDVSRSCPSIKRVISVDSEIFRDMEVRLSDMTTDIQVDGNDLACILYTSGTTAEPKGVMLSHWNLLSNCDSLAALGLIKRKDTIISVLPLHHAYPLTTTMIFVLLYGCKIVYPGTLRGETLLGAAREAAVTVFIAVPRIFYSFYQKIMDTFRRIPFPLSLLLRAAIEFLYEVRKTTGINLSRYFLYGIHRRFGSSMRLFVSGGAKLDEKVGLALFKFGFTIVEGYGLTETSPILTINPPQKMKAGSVGLPIPDVELKIVDKSREGIGEVVARGPNIMRGYYGREDLTASVIRKGWFYTGDLGYIDRDGYLFLTGRLKEVIVLSSGMNVYPEEVEKAYTGQAPVKEMCVFEAPLKKGMEEISALWAVVVPDLELFRKYGEVNLRAVIRERFENVSRELPAHMRLAGFFITLEDLPRTILGKIKRYAVRNAYISRVVEERHLTKPKDLSEEDLKLMETDIARRIIDYLERQRGDRKSVVPGDLLELDLGIDSLGRIELASGLERLLGIEIEDEVVGKAFTVRDLIVGVNSLLPAEETLQRSIKADWVGDKTAGTSPLHEEGKDIFSTQWGEVLKIPPRKENLKKIDLRPGAGAWLSGFLFSCLVYVFFRVCYGLRVEGRGNLPRKGPYILYANHTSYFDGFLIAAALPHFPRLDLFFVGFRAYVDVPVVRNLIRVGRIIPLDFSSHFLEALRSCYYVLKNGKALCLFPEGLRTLDGNIGEFKKGFGILVKETASRIVPVLIEGAYQAWPRTSKFPGRHPIKVRFGRALAPGDVERRGRESGAEDGYEAICVAARDALIKLQSRPNDVFREHL